MKKGNLECLEIATGGSWGPWIYSYLSAVASETILDALNGGIAGMSDVQEICTIRLAAEPVGIYEKDFFEGLSKYISSSRPGNGQVVLFSADGRSALKRKAGRNKRNRCVFKRIQSA